MLYKALQDGFNRRRAATETGQYAALKCGKRRKDARPVLLRSCAPAPSAHRPRARRITRIPARSFAHKILAQNSHKKPAPFAVRASMRNEAATQSAQGRPPTPAERSQQRGTHDELRRCLVGGDGDVVDHGNAHERLDIGVVRLSLQGVPEKDHEVDVPLRDFAPICWSPPRGPER